MQDRVELLALAPVLLQLRPAYTAQSLVERILFQMQHGFRTACLYEDGKPVCVAGFVIVEKLAWGRTLYVDDLVTDAHSRSTGAGHAMMDWLKDLAGAEGCEQVHLDSGVARTEAHRFYEREGFDRASYHFSLKGISSDSAVEGD